MEKFPGGEISDCRVLDGVMVEKDATHPRMRRRIVNPRIVLLDCPLEYKKAESAMNLEITKEEDFEAILKQEEDFIQRVCSDIIALKPDLVITEKCVPLLAYLPVRTRALLTPPAFFSPSLCWVGASRTWRRTSL